MIASRKRIVLRLRKRRQFARAQRAEELERISTRRRQARTSDRRRVRRLEEHCLKFAVRGVRRRQVRKSA